MIKDLVSQLYHFISKMMVLVEEDLRNYEVETLEGSASIKKNMTSLLQKLVALVLQLNKLSKDESLYLEQGVATEDHEILERFIRKYKHQDK